MFCLLQTKSLKPEILDNRRTAFQVCIKQNTLPMTLKYLGMYNGDCRKQPKVKKSKYQNSERLGLRQDFRMTNQLNYLTENLIYSHNSFFPYNKMCALML